MGIVDGKRMGENRFSCDWHGSHRPWIVQLSRRNGRHRNHDDGDAIDNCILSLATTCQGLFRKSLDCFFSYSCPHPRGKRLGVLCIFILWIHFLLRPVPSSYGPDLKRSRIHMSSETDPGSTHFLPGQRLSAIARRERGQVDA